MEIFADLRREQKFTLNLIEKFEREYGKTFFKALEKIEKDDQKIQKLRFIPSDLTLWIIQGEKQEYIIYPDLFCDCKSFLMNVIYRKKTYFPCKHLLAQKIAESLNKFQEKIYPDQEFSHIVENLLK